MALSNEQVKMTQSAVNSMTRDELRIELLLIEEEERRIRSRMSIEAKALNTLRSRRVVIEAAINSATR